MTAPDPDLMRTIVGLHQRADDKPEAVFIEAGAASYVVVELSAPGGSTLFVRSPEFLDALIAELSNVAVTWQIQRHDAEVPC